MTSGGDAGDLPFPSNFPPPSPLSNDGGEFLLRLVRNRHQQHEQHQQLFLPHNLFSSSPTSPSLSFDPAVAAVGPSVPSHHLHQNHYDHSRSPYSLSPQTQNPNFFFQGFPRPSPPPSHAPSIISAPHQHLDPFRRQQHQQSGYEQQGTGYFGIYPNTSTSSNSVEDESLRLKKVELAWGLLKERELGPGLGAGRVNGFDPNRRIDPHSNWGHDSPEQRWSGPPPGFSNRWRDSDYSSNVARDISSSSSELNRQNHRGFGSSSKSHEKERSFSSRDNGSGLRGQLDHPGLPAGSNLHSISVSDVERSLLSDHGGEVDNDGVNRDDIDDLSEQLVDSVLGEDQSDEKTDSNAKKKHQRDKDFRSDARGKWILPQRIRSSRRLTECRRDIDRFDASFLSIFESLIPAEEEKAKQKQLLTLLEKLVCKEWPKAKLYLYGSCANSFGVSKSDIDVCLAIDDPSVNKVVMLLKLADILQSDNLQDVQALTRARVPIVKLMDPVTGISCDICINNVLAVVNTKLLRDYGEIDVRLRQLAFLVKHWAKSRGVNETYQGTLSSYAYVLMCIHFLQQRNPPILPCLQRMKATYGVTVDSIECTFFDQVERLREFGSRNNEYISKLLWGFFNYWAYRHDYANHVVSVRAGCILRKHEKDWTRRVGNDRHLICIEDPFETSHDLGRVVDKRSIRVLREEFERAAEIMQNDPNPCVTLFEPYVPI